MQKKVFLRKGGSKGTGGGPPYVKYMLWAILGLSLAVVAASYLLSSKSREAARRAVPEKQSVRKELPKPPEVAPGELPPSERFPGGLAAKPETPTEPAKPLEPASKPEPQPAPLAKPAEPAPLAKPAEPAPLAKPAEPAPLAKPAEPAPLAKPAEPAPRDIFPKSPSAPPLTQKAPPPAAQKALPGQPAEKAEKKGKKEPAKTARTGPAAPEAKPETKAVSAAAQTGGFAVQVGSYKEKQSAEEVRERLRKKGYDVVLRPSGGGSYTVVTKPVPSMSKASTLAEQLKSEQKVSPTVIRMSAGGGMDDAALKAAIKKPAVSKPAAKPSSEKKAIVPVAEKKAEKPTAAAKKPQPAGKPQPAAAKPKKAVPAKADAAQ